MDATQEQLRYPYVPKKCLGGPIEFCLKTGNPKLRYLFFDMDEASHLKQPVDEWPCALDGEPHTPGSVTERGIVPDNERNRTRYQTLLRKFFDSKIEATLQVVLTEIRAVKKHLGID
jgi:hypothetical protein